MEDVILEMRHITKVYGTGVVAIQNADFSLKRGEIHALAGENGAGKSTLMKVLFGIESMDDGEILVKGKPATIHSPSDALKLGIGMVHQHFMLIESLTVAENIFLGIEPGKNGFLSKTEAVAKAIEISKKYNLPVDPKEKVENLSVGMKQRVEILKALARNVDVLILDEPTAVLTPQETRQLFAELEFLRANGHSIVFISHKLNEIKELCDRLTILRKGVSQGVYDVTNISENEISHLMIGRDIAFEPKKKPFQMGKVVLKMQNIQHYRADGQHDLKNINLCVHSGEILGIAGVDGNGQTVLSKIISHAIEPSEGIVSIEGESIRRISIKALRKKGAAVIPEDRMTHGASTQQGIWENLIPLLLDDKKYCRKAMLNHKQIHEEANKLIQEYGISCDDDMEPVGMLSGGNIQKVVAARELSGSPKFILADQPTRGIDVGASEFIREKLIKLRDQGAAILLISADLNEVISLSDRLIVLSGGEITAFYPNCSNIDTDELGLYMLGVKKQEEEVIGGVAVGNPIIY